LKTASGNDDMHLLRLSENRRLLRINGCIRNRIAYWRTAGLRQKRPVASHRTRSLWLSNLSKLQSNQWNLKAPADRKPQLVTFNKGQVQPTLRKTSRSAKNWSAETEKL
jgi:hypothetical protein